MGFIQIFLAALLFIGLFLWLLARIAYYSQGSKLSDKYSFRQFTAIHFGTGHNYINFIDRGLKILAFSALIISVWHQY